MPAGAKRLGFERVKIRSQKLNPGFPVGVRKPVTEAITAVVWVHINRKLQLERIGLELNPRYPSMGHAHLN